MSVLFTTKFSQLMITEQVPQKCKIKYVMTYDELQKVQRTHINVALSI